MTKARDLANLIAAGNPLADGAISVAEISDLTASAAELNQLDNTADLPDIRPSLLLDFANSKTLDPRITFTRGSTATYYDGKTTAKAEENLVTYSQALNAWGKVSVTTTSDTVAAPDGTTTAETITAQAGTQQCRLNQGSKTVVSSSDYTFSFYVKSNTETVVQLAFGNFAVAGDQVYANYNLSSGAVGTVGTGATATITDVGNSWYRLTLSGQFTSSGSTGELLLSLCKGDASAGRLPTKTFDGTESIYAWGAQFEQRSSATAYTATTSSPIVKYQPVLQTAASGEARFDHDPVTGESKGLLIEEARTNLVSYSEDTSQWSEVGTTTITNQTQVAPDGTSTATLVDIGATGESLGPNRISYGATGLTAGNTATVSVYLKKPDTNAASHISVRAYCAGTTASDAYVDYRTSDFETVQNSNNVDTVHASQEVGNGWYRVSFTFTLDASGTGAWDLRVGGLISGGYTATGTDFIFWGAQVEEGSFPTSYIPTSGSTVTRAVDAAVITGDNFTPWYRQDEGTVFVDFEYQYAIGGGFPRSVEIGSSSTAINRLNVYSSNSSGNLIATGRTNDVAEVSILLASAPDSPVSGKVSFAFAEDDSAASFNGGVSGTDTACKIISNIPRDVLGIGGGVNDTNAAISGTIKKIAYYPKRLPDATLQAMTEA